MTCGARRPGLQVLPAKEAVADAQTLCFCMYAPLRTRRVGAPLAITASNTVRSALPICAFTF